MTHQLAMTRRGLLAGAATLAATKPLRAAATPPKVVVTKDPNCGCCGGWVEHLLKAGFPVEVKGAKNLGELKTRLGVPDSLTSCHTAVVEHFVLEGHVPASAIQKLLAERPLATGLAVPGMPIGSPGMEVEGGDPDTYSVILFGPTGQRIFGRYRGAAST